MEIPKGGDVKELCVALGIHRFIFLRSEERENYNKKVDIFYCEKCLHYAEKVVWQGRRG